MKTLTYKISFLILFSGLFFSCSGPVGPEGPQGPAGYDANVIYSEWFIGSWSGTSGDWYFDADAPDLTADVVERGVILAYISIKSGDVYAATVRPLPCYAVNANWDFLIPGGLGTIEFTSDLSTRPTSNYEFRFIAIPGNITAKSASVYGKTVSEWKSMPYKDVCKILNIKE